jgi:hypothetical protein
MQQISKGLYLSTIILGEVLGGLVLIAGLVALAIADEAKGTSNADVAVVTGLALLLAGGLAVLVAEIVAYVLIYKMWAIIQDDGRARTTPGAAVGLLFVPCYNLFWVFQVYMGWAQDFNGYIRRHRLRVPPAPEGLGTSVAIFMLLGAIPYIGAVFSLVSLVVRLVFFASAIDGHNALLLARENAYDDDRDAPDDYGGRFGDRDRKRSKDEDDQDQQRDEGYYGRSGDVTERQ